MNAEQSPHLETDPRFPSGPWTGFYLQKNNPGRHLMELRLTFQNGVMIGEGRDRVGPFHVKGGYNLADGKCYWTKKYVGKHDVFYQGFNEGKGIWGVWELAKSVDEQHTAPGQKKAIGIVSPRGGFHIWPEGMGDPTNETLSAEADLPAGDEVLVEVGAGAAP